MPAQAPFQFNAKRKIAVDNASDYGGNLVESSGIDLRKSNDVDAFEGDYATGSKLFPHTTPANDSLLEMATAFAYSNCNWTGLSPTPETFSWFVACLTHVFSTTSLNSHFAHDTATGAPTVAQSGDMVVFGNSWPHYAPVNGTGTLSTVGTSNQIVVTAGSMVGALRDAIITVSPAPSIVGIGRLYTGSLSSGPTNIVQIAGGTTSQLAVGAVINGSNVANPTNPINITVSKIIDANTFEISGPAIDIVYGVAQWTYHYSGATFNLSSDGTATGATSYAQLDLSAGGFTWTYQNPGSLVDRLLVGTADDIWMKTAGGWTPNWWTANAGSGGLSQQKFHAPPKFVPMPSLARLYIIDANYIHYLQQDYGFVVPFTYVNSFTASMVCDWCVNDDTNIYIGVHDTHTGVAGVWVYQNLGILSPTNQFNGDLRFFNMTADGRGSGTGFVWKNVLYIVHPDGSLKAFNGSGFDTVAHTPGYKKNVPFDVYRHGVSVDGKTFWFLTKGRLNAYGAGLWKCDTDTWNFYLQSQPITRSGISGELPQFGEQVLSDAGALYFDGTDFLAGIVAKDGPSYGTTDYPEISCSTNRFSALYKAGGWFATSKLVFGTIKEASAKLWTKYLAFSGEAIKLRFRSKVYAQGTPGGRTEDLVTWQTYVPPVGPAVSGIKFTTTANISEVEVGDEVTLTHGTNAGLTSFVASLALASGTYTVILEDAIGLQPAKQSYVTWRKWKKIKTLNKTGLQSDDTTVPFGSNPSEWLQVKALMEGDTVSVKDIRLNVQPNID